MDYVDHYEVLEVSPNANSETIERIFRHLARRYHPDNAETGDRDRFDQVVEAYNTLRDPTRRAQYDVEHHGRDETISRLAERVISGRGVDRALSIQANVLSILYERRRESVTEPGVGDGELGHLLDVPVEHMAFSLWYMREKG